MVFYSMLANLRAKLTARTFVIVIMASLLAVVYFFAQLFSCTELSGILAKTSQWLSLGRPIYGKESPVVRLVFRSLVKTVG